MLGWLQIPATVLNLPDEYKWEVPVPAHPPSRDRQRTAVANVCRRCGRAFWGKQSKVGKFCSVSCATSDRPPSHGGSSTLRCAMCKKDFTIKNSRVKAGQRYCSRRCARRGRGRVDWR